MNPATTYPHLARFLADHFGGYEDAESAAKEEGEESVEAYVEEFLRPLKGEGLDPEERVQFYEAVAAADKFCAENADFDAMRAKHFNDAGDPLLSLRELEDWTHQPGFKFLGELVWHWN